MNSTTVISYFLIILYLQLSRTIFLGIITPVDNTSIVRNQTFLKEIIEAKRDY